MILHGVLCKLLSFNFFVLSLMISKWKHRCACNY